MFLLPPATPFVPYPAYHHLDRRAIPGVYSSSAAAMGDGLELLLQEGDLLYLPPFWWHEVSSVGQPQNVSFSSWFTERASSRQLELAGLEPHVGFAVVRGFGRNLEKYVWDAEQAREEHAQAHGIAIKGGGARAARVAAQLQAASRLLCAADAGGGMVPSKLDVGAESLVDEFGPALSTFFGGVSAHIFLAPSQLLECSPSRLAKRLIAVLQKAIVGRWLNELSKGSMAVATSDAE